MSFNSNFVSTPSRTILDMPNLRWDHEEPFQAHRSPFSKDRDRILYSKSFLRLRSKTQVFMLQKNDYIRTRLTHSLEVNQIAKSIASALGQNIELVEAIALGHDVGHTPFGHIGERTLAQIVRDEIAIPDGEKGFKHNLQALRLLCDLEKGADYPNSKGLNLTKYTLWGISHHSSIKPILDAKGKPVKPIKTEHPVYDTYLNAIDSYWSFEGLIVALADEIAQRHHDIEDSLAYGIIHRDTLLDEISKFHVVFGGQEKTCFKRLQSEIKTLDDPVFKSLFARLVVNLYVTDAIKQIKENLRGFEHDHAINKQQDFQNQKANLTADDYGEIVSLSPQLKALDDAFQDFLKSNILSSYQAQAMDGKAEYIVKKLFKAFKDNPQQLPDNSLRSFADFIGQPYQRSMTLGQINGNEKVLYRCIVDYIGGMTDNFAYEEFDRLYGTKI